MADPVKFLSAEIGLDSTTANDVSKASLVRILNLDANSVLITHSYSNGTTISTFSLSGISGGSPEVNVIKTPTDKLKFTGTITANNVKAVSIGYY